jgi:hypothetical protein
MFVFYRKLLVIFVILFVLQGRSFAAEGPQLRTGLWVTEKTSVAGGEPGKLEAAVRGNKYLSGVCLTASWDEIEKESGKIDFGAIDKAVAVMRRIGMKYELALKPGVDTPAYVFGEGARPFETRVSNPHRPNAGEAVRIPIPWDPIYQRNFSRVIEELGKRYSSDPLCVSVVLTCANFMSKEMHLPKSAEDRTKWRASGDYGTKLLEVYKKYTDEWGKAFPKQAISLHLAKVADLSPSFNERVIDYGLSKYPERFAIQNCQLSGRKEDTGNVSYDLVLKYGDRVHHGFQSLAGFSHSGPRMGSIEMATLNVVHATGEYWELWHGDGMSPRISGSVLNAWQEAEKLGYEGYKKKLVAESRYRATDNYERPGKKGPGRKGRRRGTAEPEAEPETETEPES